MAKTFSIVLGIVFLLVGILGFVMVPREGGNLLGIFAVNTSHNLIHVAAGVLGIAAGYMGWSKIYCQVFGVIYLLVAVLGFIPGLSSGGMLLGIVHINMADNILHLAVGAASAYVGFTAPSS